MMRVLFNVHRQKKKHTDERNSLISSYSFYYFLLFFLLGHSVTIYSIVIFVKVSLRM
jgi:hypothetical protein